MRIILISVFTGILICLLFLSSCEHSQAESGKTKSLSDTEMVARGKYIVQIGGCNDCHAVGYAEANGKLSESEWLTGSPVGFSGPWGTSYAANLRLTVTTMNEDVWVEMCRTRNGLPPMPWPSLHLMTDQDLRSLYRYITSLGPKGKPAPILSGPGVEPTTPYIEFVPKHLERLSASAGK